MPTLLGEQMLKAQATSTRATDKELVDVPFAEVSIGDAGVIRQMEGPWRQLCDETKSDVCLRPEWITAYINAFESSSEIVLITARVRDSLLAVLPLIRKWDWFAGMPVLKLMAPANSHSNRFDILRACGPTGDAAIDAMWGLLKRIPNWHLLELPCFPAEGHCQRLMSCATRDEYGTMTRLCADVPVLRMVRDGNGRLTWLAETSRHFRHELRRFRRVLEGQTGGIPKLVRKEQADPELLRQFFELEASGWKGREGSAINSSPKALAFYMQVARMAAPLGQFCLHSLEASGRMVAGAFSLVTNECYYPMKITYDESFHRGGPGQLLINDILEECAARGIPELYFGGTRDRYKTLWTSASQRQLRGYIFNRSYYSRLMFQVRTRFLPKLRQTYSFFRGQLSRKDQGSAPRTSHENPPSDNGPAKSNYN